MDVFNKGNSSVKFDLLLPFAAVEDCPYVAVLNVSFSTLPFIDVPMHRDTMKYETSTLSEGRMEL